MGMVLDSRVRGVSMFRAVGSQGRGYTIAEGSWNLIEQTFRQAKAVGYVWPAGSDGAYAVLDLLDEDDDVVQDFVIPNARAFRWWYRKLGLRVDRDS